MRQLLQSIALEETALAHVLNAEAEKIEGVGERLSPPGSFDDVLAFQRTVAEVLQVIVRKEEVLLRKLQVVAALLAEDDGKESEGGEFEGGCAEADIS